MFIKKKSFKFLFQIFFLLEIYNTFFNFLIFLVNVWTEKSISIPIYPGIIYFWIWLFDGVTYQGGGRDRARNGEGALMSNLCLISHRCYDVDKLTVPGCSNWNLSFSGAQKNGKSITFFFIKFNAKGSPKLSDEGWLLFAGVRSLLSKLIFTHIVSCWSLSHEIVEK